jgi:DnaJ family protein C protein 28
MADEKDLARNRASEYKQAPQPSDAPQTPKKNTRSLEQWATAASEAIEEAMRQGGFDNLSGKGKPLNLNRDPFAPADSALAFDILKNNDLTPGWMQDRNDLLRDIDKWRASLHQTVTQANSAYLSAKTPGEKEAFANRWQAQRRGLQAQVDEYNRRIGTINLQLPAISMEVFKLRLHEELHKAGALIVE